MAIYPPAGSTATAWTIDLLHLSETNSGFRADGCAVVGAIYFDGKVEAYIKIQAANNLFCVKVSSDMLSTSFADAVLRTMPEV